MATFAWIIVQIMKGWKYSKDRLVPPLCSHRLIYYYYWYRGGWSPIGSTRHCGHQWPIVPAPGDYDNGQIGGMMIGRGNRSTRRKPAPVPLCPPQTPHAARRRTRAAAVGSQRLTAWATARPAIDLSSVHVKQQFDPCVLYNRRISTDEILMQ
jgi:hypothetical protein